MSHTELSEYKVYRQTVKRLLVIIGIWPGKPPSFLCRFFVGVQLAHLTATIMAMVCFLVTNITNVAAVTIAINSLMSFVTVFAKFIWMLGNRDNVSKVHQILDPHIIQLLEHPTKPTNLLKGVVIFRHLTWLFAGGLCLSVIIYTSIPLVFLIYQYRNQIKPVQYIYIHPAIYPWEISASGFPFLFLYELIPHLTLSCVNIGINALFTFHVFQMVVQMREMSHRVLHIDYKSDTKIVVRQCVNQYQELMQCRDLLDEVYGPIILWIMLTNALILCSLMFQISQMKSIPVGKVVLYAIYFLVILTETLMFAWSGSILTEEGELYRNALYDTNWHSSKDLATFVLMMLMQKSLILTACKFSQVSVHIFTKVINTAMSYFFLLRAIQNDV